MKLHSNIELIFFFSLFFLQASLAVFNHKEKKILILPGIFLLLFTIMGVVCDNDIIMICAFEILSFINILYMLKGEREYLFLYVITHIFSGTLIIYALSHLGFPGQKITPIFFKPDFEHYMANILYLGLIINIGLFPFSYWFIKGYSNCRPIGTVFLTCFASKFALIMLWKIFSPSPYFIYVGLFTLIYGSVYSIFSNNPTLKILYLVIAQTGLEFGSLAVTDLTLFPGNVLQFFLPMLVILILNAQKEKINFIPFVSAVICLLIPFSHFVDHFGLGNEVIYSIYFKAQFLFSFAIGQIFISYYKEFSGLNKIRTNLLGKFLVLEIIVIIIVNLKSIDLKLLVCSLASFLLSCLVHKHIPKINLQDVDIILLWLGKKFFYFWEVTGNYLYNYSTKIFEVSKLKYLDQILLGKGLYLIIFSIMLCLCLIILL